MNLFLSYTSSDRAKLQPLLDGLHRLKYTVWLDQELSGGQEWWDAILGQIRAADVLVVAVSPALIDSEACHREVSYARAVGRSILPVMIESVRPEFLPRDIATVQIVDFSTPDGAAAFSLMGALQQLPAPTPLPDKLPDPPPVPVSYLNELSQKILGPERLGMDEQQALVPKLRLAVSRPRERDAAVQLIAAFKQRDDLLANVGRDLDAIQIPPPESGGGHAPGFYPDPMKRHQERWFDGSAWTPRVRDSGVETLEGTPPAKTPKASNTTTWIVVGGVIGAVAVLVVALLVINSIVPGTLTGSVSSPSPAPSPASSPAQASTATIDMKALILPSSMMPSGYNQINSQALTQHGWNGWDEEFTSPTGNFSDVDISILQLPDHGDRTAELKEAQCDTTFTGGTQPTLTTVLPGQSGSGMDLCQYTFSGGYAYEYQLIHNGFLIEVAFVYRNVDLATAVQEAEAVAAAQASYIDANR